MEWVEEAILREELAEWRDAVEEATLPIVEPDGVVTSTTLVGRKLGTIRAKDPGTAKEGLVCYCQRHGCSVIRTKRTKASYISMRRWFAAGEDIPVGSGGKARHLALWPAITGT